MSGHSKWHSIKHQKGAADKARGKVFARLARQIEVAARQGGGDPEANPLLRLQIQKARGSSMPKDNIERAIKRGTGEVEGVHYEEINYEGYAPCGIALYVETLTDNRNRTGADVKSIFNKNDGSMAEPGSVSWQFSRIGEIKIAPQNIDEDEFILEVIDMGAVDVTTSDSEWIIETEASDLASVQNNLTEKGIQITSADLTMKPSTTIELNTADEVKKVFRVIEALEDNDDVQNVFANWDASDALIEEALSQ